jgi:hypothetical protein
MPVTRYKPLDEIASPNHDWSDLAPLADQVRREGWGQEATTPKVKRRLATHVAPERPQDVTEAKAQVVGLGCHPPGWSPRALPG